MTAIQKYREQTIQSMTDGDLIILLYDQAVKDLHQAIFALKEKQYEPFEKATGNCKDIFFYLISILDRRYPVGQELYNLYTFFNLEISKAEIKREDGILDPLLPIVESMRDTWAEANRIVTKNK